MKRVLLWNSNSKRDLLGIRLLEKALRKKGLLTKVCNDDQMKMQLSTFRPDGLIAARGNNAVIQQSAQACKVFIVPGEGNQMTKETMLSVFMGRSFFKLDSVEWIERCYLWGEPTKKWLLDTGLFNEAQIKVVGNTRIDIYRDKDLLGQLRSRKPKKFVLGVAISAKSTSTANDSSPRYANTYFNMHPEAEFPFVPKGRHFEDICWRDHAILRLTMRYMNRFLQMQKGDIVYRPSPFEDPREYRFLNSVYDGRVRLKDDQPLPEFLCGIDALLTCWSTTGLEALLLGIPVISIAGTMNQEHLFRHISPKASGFESYVPFYHRPEILKKAAQGQLRASPKTDEELEQLLHDTYTWSAPRSACEEISDDVYDTLMKASEPSADQWKKAVTHKYPVPKVLLKSAYTASHLMDYWKSGAFRNYYRFRKNKVRDIEKLVKQYSFSN
jgi:surface carbohydrate biosynthesis protein